MGGARLYYSNEHGDDSGKSREELIRELKELRERMEQQGESDRPGHRTAPGPDAGGGLPRQSVGGRPRAGRSREGNPVRDHAAGDRISLRQKIYRKTDENLKALS